MLLKEKPGTWILHETEEVIRKTNGKMKFRNMRGGLKVTKGIHLPRVQKRGRQNYEFDNQVRCCWVLSQASFKE